LNVLLSPTQQHRRWKPKLFRKAPRKVGAHTAMSDIKESLAELRYYKQALFKGS
jgi:oligoribonuclease